jgi:hypothetical protein
MVDYTCINVMELSKQLAKNHSKSITIERVKFKRFSFIFIKASLR